MFPWAQAACGADSSLLARLIFVPACSQGKQQLAIGPGCSATQSQELQRPGYKRSLVETRSRCDTLLCPLLQPVFPISHPCCFMQEGLTRMVQFPRAPYQPCHRGVCGDSGKISYSGKIS